MHERQWPQERSEIGTENYAESQLIIRFIRLKDVGTRLLPGEQRNNKIIEKAAPLPEGNRLKSRAIYCFVTTEEVNVIIEDEKLFAVKEQTQFVYNDKQYYLTHIEFRLDKRGTIVFLFNNGVAESIECCSSKRMKLNPPEVINSALLNIDSNVNNTNQIQPNPETTEINNTAWTFQAPVHYNRVTAAPLRIFNFLLLVPDESDLITIANSALQEIGFEKEVSSSSRQHLYTKRDSETNIQHILLVPYANLSRYSKIAEYLQFASEAILLIENLDEQKDSFMVISKVQNVNLTSSWDFVVKSSLTDFGVVELDYSKLKKSAQLLLSIFQLRKTVVGGASMKQERASLPLTDFLLRWTIGEMSGPAVQNIFVCFKFEPKIVKAFTEYAAITLAALNIEYEYEGVVCWGSVLVYIQCPGYIPWYIMLHKEEIFNKLAEEGLTEIYECFISDVEKSMLRLDNVMFIDELIYLKEQMIIDGISEHDSNRFKVSIDELPLPKSIETTDAKSSTVNTALFEKESSPTNNFDFSTNQEVALYKGTKMQNVFGDDDELPTMAPKDTIHKNIKSCCFCDGQYEGLLHVVKLNELENGGGKSNLLVYLVPGCRSCNRKYTSTLTLKRDITRVSVSIKGARVKKIAVLRD